MNHYSQAIQSIFSNDSNRELHYDSCENIFNDGEDRLINIHMKDHKEANIERKEVGKKDERWQQKYLHEIRGEERQPSQKQQIQQSEKQFRQSSEKQQRENEQQLAIRQVRQIRQARQSRQVRQTRQIRQIRQQITQQNLGFMEQQVGQFTFHNRYQEKQQFDEKNIDYSQIKVDNSEKKPNIFAIFGKTNYKSSQRNSWNMTSIFETDPIPKDQKSSNDLNKDGQRQKQKMKKIISQQSLKIQEWSVKDQDLQCLQILLKSSRIYKNYLHKKVQKKISLYIPELQQAQSYKLPFFKPQRVQFKKMKSEQKDQCDTPLYLCRINPSKTRFYFQKLQSYYFKKKSDRILCSYLKISEEDRISPHSDYDHVHKRFYLFSNHHQALMIYGETSMELLCKIPVQKQAINPNIHFLSYKGRYFILLLGGYFSFEKKIAQGNNFIEILEVKKQSMNLKSKLIKLNIGRINPIVFTKTYKRDDTLFILGGNTIAQIDNNGNLDFEYQKQINESTNFTGIIINCKQITQLFDYHEQVKFSNISVKVEDPFIMHSGIISPIHNNLYISLPNSKNLYVIKISQKQVNIIEAVPSILSKRPKEYQKRQLSIRREDKNIIVYKIDEDGRINIQYCEQDHARKCCSCCIY